jgi:hypothetical protein
MKLICAVSLACIVSLTFAYEDTNLFPAFISLIAAIKNTTTNDANIGELRSLLATKDPWCSKCPSCTACLQCCMTDRISKFKIDQATVDLIKELDWNCPCTACPLQCGFRQSLLNKHKQEIGEMLSILNFNCQEGSLDCKIKNALESFVPIKNINNQEDDFATFFKKLSECHICTACPLQCAVRKVYAK